MRAAILALATALVSSAAAHAIDWPFTKTATDLLRQIPYGAVDQSTRFARIEDSEVHKNAHFPAFNSEMIGRHVPAGIAKFIRDSNWARSRLSA